MGFDLSNSSKSETTEVIELHEDGWGFWDEVWCDFHGGYASRELAEQALKEYCINVLGDTYDT